MNFSLVFFVNSILLGVALAMDAFSVSMANGLNDPCMKKSRITLVAGTFAFFQFIMPVIGWFFVKTAAEYFAVFQKAIPWIAFVLLGFIGGKMLIEGIKTKDQGIVCKTQLVIWELLLQGVATSIDALSVGFTISEYNALEAIMASLIIAITTFIICVFGIIIGKTFGTKLAGKASILGGVILIGIGIEIIGSSFLQL